MSDKFNPLSVSSKFAICGLPLRLDTYSLCSFQCTYCFANNRQFGKKPNKEPNIEWLRNKFHKVYDECNVNGENFLDVLLSDGVTLHGGGMSDCFQPIEQEKQNTKKIVEICNEYDQHILFSTKSDNVYDVPLSPQLHSFQLSITNFENKLEENVPSIHKRKQFFETLKDQGFKVGIRIQPFIPNVTDVKGIVEMFDGAEHYVVECLKLNPHTIELNNRILDYLGLSRKDYIQKGLLTLKPQLRLELYNDFLDFFKENDYSWSIADNDLHYLGNNSCCCGDKLINNQTDFHNTRMLKEYGKNYSLEDISREADKYKLCKCTSLFNSDRREGCKTVWEFYRKRFDRKSSPFSPKFQFYNVQKTLNDYK